MNNKNSVKSFELNGKDENLDVVCLSHLRWGFVYQRPQHLLSRFAKTGRVFFFEEPIFSDERLFSTFPKREDNLFVVVPHISHEDRETGDVAKIQRRNARKTYSDQRNQGLSFCGFTRRRRWNLPRI